MKLKEMIKVMQHYDNGGDVEFSEDNFKTILGKSIKNRDGDLSWDWENFKYRIKKQKITIEKWLCLESNGDYEIIESSNVNKFKLYKKVKLLESYEIEL